MLAALLGGCVIEVPNPLEAFETRGHTLPLDETGPWTNNPPTEKELIVARSNFSTEIVRFTDARRPRSMELHSSDQLIYEYAPDNLIGGTNYQIPALMGKFLSYKPKQTKHYMVELELKRLETVIKTGTFWSGSFGRYSANMELQATVRRPDSQVVLMRTYRYDPTQPREDYNGRGPTKERDRARMYDLVETMMREAAQDINWDIRQRDARHWKPPVPESVPTRLNQPPVDRVSTTPDADAMPPVNAPLMMPMPFVVPSTPAEAEPEIWLEEPLPYGMPMDDDLNAPMPEDAPMGPDMGEDGIVI